MANPIIEGKEIISTFDFNQFVKDESVDQCGPAAVSLIHYAGAPGKPAQGSPGDALALMKDLYTQFIGPDVPSDTGGTSTETLYKMIVSVGNHYQNLYPDGGVNGDFTVNGKIQGQLKDAICQWVEVGYPVIVAVSEDSVYDMGLRKKPYNWNTTGLDHIFTITGVSSSGIDFLVRDTANVLAPGPRMYASYQLKILSATVVVPGRTLWLPRPKSVKASDMSLPVSSHNPVTVPPAPVVQGKPVEPAPALSKHDVEVKIQELTQQLAELTNQLVSFPDEVTQVTTQAPAPTAAAQTWLSGVAAHLATAPDSVTQTTTPAN